MRGDRERGARTGAGTTADDVARFVDNDIFKTVFLHEAGDFFAAHSFGKRGRFDLRDADLFGHGAFDFIGADLEGGGDLRIGRERGEALGHARFNCGDIVAGRHCLCSPLYAQGVWRCTTNGTRSARTVQQ